MKPILPGIATWSWFSEEKQLNFNGYLLDVGEHRILVDPPPLSDADLSKLANAGQVDYILLTNRDHERESATYKDALNTRVYVPQADAEEMSVTSDKTFVDGELLPGGIWVIHLSDQKSLGESALFIQQGRGVLIVGDALLGKPEGSVSMLPAEKYTDPAKAREGLRRLLKYNFDSLLVGDGTSILTGAKAVVTQTLE
jgi:glyoxylase-like metal-dependent hydrolase (beta-lactamase superfamily II)